MGGVNYAGEWVTLVGAAELLGVSREAVYYRVRSRQVPIYRIGRTVLLRTADLPLLKKKRRG